MLSLGLWEDWELEWYQADIDAGDLSDAAELSGGLLFPAITLSSASLSINGALPDQGRASVDLKVRDIQNTSSNSNRIDKLCNSFDPIVLVLCSH